MSDQSDLFPPATHKAISLWQPWASLWVSDRKIHETRHWPTSYRGWLLVHAAKRFEKDFPYESPLHAILDSEFGNHWGIDLPTGALIGMVRLVGCVPIESLPPDHAGTDDFVCGDFSAGRFAWRRTDYEVFARPIPYRGAQGFFNVPSRAMTGPLT